MSSSERVRSKLLSRCALVLFDLDGTLVDSVPDIFFALQRALDAVSVPSVSEEQCRHWVGNGAQVLVNRALHRELEVDSEHLLLSRALEAFYTAYEQENGKQSRVYDGALELLKGLRSHGVKVAIVTNKPYQFALPLLASLGLEYDGLWGGDSVVNKKPQPDMLLAAMVHFGVPACESFMVGDSVNDFAAARAAGCQSVGVSYGYNHGKAIDANDADYLVDSLTELG